MILQTLLQPMLLVFIFGRVMTTSGFMPLQYKSLLLPGIIALSMLLAGVWSVAMPLVSEFQFSKRSRTGSSRRSRSSGWPSKRSSPA